MKTKIYLLILFYIMLMNSTCDLPHHPGPMPKEIIDLKFEPGLNVFGIIRLNENNPESFVYLHEALKTKDFYKYEDSNIYDASVIISDEDSVYNFHIQNEIDSIRYINQNFIPKEREIYYLEIDATTENGDLHLYAEAQVPTIPAIKNLEIKENQTLVQLITTDDAFYYELILFFENEEIKQPLLINENNNKEIIFHYSDKYGKPLLLGIAAYDKNLAKYLNASTGIIPQTYQEPISTVENGYGCFGAISLNTFDIE